MSQETRDTIEQLKKKVREAEESCKRYSAPVPLSSNGPIMKIGDDLETMSRNINNREKCLKALFEARPSVE